MSTRHSIESEGPEVRGLELHSSRIWDRVSIERAANFMSEVGMNALVFHQTDIIDKLVLPDRYFGEALALGKWPEFPILKTRLLQENNRKYMNQVIRYLHSKGIKLFFEVKEPWYPEPLLYVHPELLDSEGQICPSNPFWWEFIEGKIEELLRHIPDIDGIIESPGTIESKVAFSYSSCSCRRCKEMSLKDWIKHVVLSMYKPLKRKGKQLVVRDFAYFPSELDAIFDVTKEIPSDVVISLKCAPHDFYPTFPNNPRIGQIDGHIQWIEFDAWGQYCGLGVFPCILLDDFRERVNYALRNGAKGSICRIDWEIVTEGWALDSLNLINLYGLQRLWEDPSSDFRDIYKNALKLLEHCDLPFLGKIKVENSTELTGVIELLQKTWPIVRRSLYIGNHLFQGSSMGAVVDSLEEARYTMREHHSLSVWDPNQRDILENLNPRTLGPLLGEKEEAFREINTIVETLKENRLGLNRRLNTSLLSLFEAFRLYIKQFYCSGKAYILTEFALSTGSTSDKENAMIEAENLERIEGELENFGPTCIYEPQSNIISMLLDPQRVFRLRSSLMEELEKA